MQEVAFAMEASKRHVWSVEDVAEFVNRRDPSVASLEDWKRYMLAVTVYGFLDNEVRTSRFAFSHASFRDYFVATKLCDEVFNERWNTFGSMVIADQHARFIVDLIELADDV